MAKLDKIEARLMLNLVYGEEDARLLIRAVRQLGEFFVDFQARGRIDKHTPVIDMDVLELLEGGE